MWITFSEYFQRREKLLFIMSQTTSQRETNFIGSLICSRIAFPQYVYRYFAKNTIDATGTYVCVYRFDSIIIRIEFRTTCRENKRVRTDILRDCVYVASFLWDTRFYTTAILHPLLERCVDLYAYTRFPLRNTE